MFMHTLLTSYSSSGAAVVEENVVRLVAAVIFSGVRCVENMFSLGGLVVAFVVVEADVASVVVVVVVVVVAFAFLLHKTF